MGLHSTFDRHQNVSCVGGRVLLHFESERPAWLNENSFWIYGMTRYGDEEIIISPPDIPIGCNMAFRRAVFDKVGCFHTALGRKGNNLLSNEENAMFSRIAQAGLVVICSPATVVHHRISSTRTSRQWVLNRFYWQGISDIALIQSGQQHLSRIALLGKALKEALTLFKRLKTADWAPKRMYWRYRSMPTEQKARLKYSQGVIRQALSEAFRMR